MSHLRHHEEEREERHQRHHEREEERHHRHHEREEEREEAYYEGREGYGRRTETDYQLDGGREGYARRTETYQVRPGGEFGYPGPVAQHTVSEAEVRLHGIEEARRHETTYQRTEYLGEAGAALAAGFAMYERHQEKIDPENLRRHKVEEEVAEGLAVAGAGTALYGHHKKSGSEHQLDELETGHKKHGFFG